MTTNQLMVLLDAHRGTLDPKRHLGTYHEDLDLLVRGGLLKAAPPGARCPYEPTPHGQARIEAALNKNPIPVPVEVLEPTVACNLHKAFELRSCFLVWEVGTESCESKPYLRGGFEERREAEEYILGAVKLWREERSYLGHHGTTERGQLEYFDVYRPCTNPHGQPTLVRRWGLQQLQFGKEL